MRRKGRVALAVALALLLSACSTAGEQQSELDPDTSASSGARPATGATGEIPRGGPSTDYSAFHESIATCLRELGWEAIGSRDRVESGAVPVGQEERYQMDYQSCSTASSALLPAAAPLDEALYALNFERSMAARACLEANGFEVPPEISLQVWRDQINSSAGYPLFTLNAPSAEEDALMRDLCPDPAAVFFSPEIEIYVDQVDYAAYWAASEYEAP
ncbi:hypothetical protein [Agrococcus sp. Marseille-Q4369]|uniref:hypothetical protein n=1 Tax=Agrococcus sp. Marseille-Q4369 TaxID=2810513 RepID=UPI001B8AA199|nr:hypothetical protein [Agrococcus sp. Marseille-Q4369]QUW18357.1 hypothetical protein JSQ78_11090 [Agrococcus sp. Marseille-Q4369]